MQQTPRTHPTVQPEIHFAGSLDVPASRASRDPAVTAAFVAFHRSTGGTDQLAPRKGYFSRGAVALASLAFLGFGGGLFLAFFSFNSPEGSSSPVAARPAEVIYTARAVAAASQDAPVAPEYAVSESPDAIAAPLFALAAPDRADPETSIWPDQRSEQYLAVGGSYISEGTPAFAGIGEPMAPAEGPSGLTPSDITVGFDALTAAPVPEPSTWATMISGAALLLVFGRLKRRRG